MQRVVLRQAVIAALLAGCGPPAPLVAEDLPAPQRRFIVGNEARHDLFARTLADRGGALMCVGGDHCYTLLALASADVTVLVDHDPRVIALHHELGRRLGAADPPALLADLTNPPAASLTESWPTITEHLRRVAARDSTWLSDPVLYARLRERWRTGAVHPVVGDLVGDRTLASIAAFARARDLEFTAIYLSNAEETLQGRGRLRGNLANLPHTADCVLLRTFYLPDWPAADGLWSYQVHSLADYLAHAGDPPAELAMIIADARGRGALRVDPRQPAFSTISSADRTSP